MRSDKSLKEIEKMSPTERWQTARDKMSSSDGNGVVSALLEHLPAHENTRWLVYSGQLSGQIPTSYAARAFAELQKSAIHHEIIRLCTFWDDVDLDSRSIPTIVALSDCSGVSRCVYNDHFSHYENFNLGIAKKTGLKARRQLRTAIRGAKEIQASDILRIVRNYRDKLAHQLEQTNEEKKSAVPVPKYGDERKLLAKTVTAVNLLYMSLNGTGFGWDEAKKMHARNAEAFWKGVTINVLR